MVNISNCNFEGVTPNQPAMKSIENLTQAILNISELFKSQNINIECLLKIVSPPIVSASPEPESKEESKEPSNMDDLEA